MLDQWVRDIADLPDFAVERQLRAVEDVAVERDVGDLRAPRILRSDIRPRLPGHLLRLVVDLEEQRLVEAVLGVLARIHAVPDDGVAPGSAAELEADILDGCLEEVDAWGGANAVHDCTAGPDRTLGKSDLELVD